MRLNYIGNYVLKELPLNRAFGLSSAIFLVLCGGAIAWAGFLQPYKINSLSQSVSFAQPLSLSLDSMKAEPYGPFLQQSISVEKDVLEAKTLLLAELDHQDVLEKCASLLSKGIVCMFVNSPSFKTNADSHRQSFRNYTEQKPRFREIDKHHQGLVLDTIEPAAGLYDLNKANDFGLYGSLPLPDHAVQKPANLFSSVNDDTVGQAAIRAAADMISNRYANAIYQAQLNDGEIDFDTQQAVALTQSALSSAAERAFESFISNNFGQQDFEGQSYEGLRGYFMTAFKNAATSSVKSIGQRFVSDITSDGHFKSLKIRSELLKGVDENIARAFIDTGLAAAKNSQYAFLRNLEVSYQIRENSKPEYSLLTLQPLYSSKGRKHNLFAQAAASYEGARNSLTGGLGYRYMPESEAYVVGSNVFLDYERTYGHMRAGAGLDIQTSLWGASANYYKGLSDWRNSTTGFEEQAQDGFDIELAGRMPFLPALEVFGRGYRWQGIDGAEDIDGRELRVEYSPVPAFTIAGSFGDEDGRESEFGLGLRYNYVFGAPAEYLYDWNEQFRQKSASEYIFSKVRRDNRIRVQERIDPDAAAADAAPAPSAALLSFGPLNAATGVSIGTNITFMFDQDVQVGTGNIVFTDLTDGSDDFTISVADPRVTIVSDSVTIDLSAQLLDFLSNYEVTFAAGVFEDLSGSNTSALNPGDYSFTTVVDPTAGFPGPTATLAPNSTGAAFSPRNVVGTWQTTMNVTGALDGVVYESGATGRGIAASFGGGNLVFAASDGSVTTTTANTIFGSFPIASIPAGLHHFVFVANPSAPAEIGVYMDGIRIIDESIAGSMASNEWAGTDGSGYGQSSGNIRAGVDTSSLTGATLTNNLSFWTSQQPADF
ncbi:MAG: inverse autotransporter beta domain-containing protein [Bdellovibrionales bacterium]